MTPTLIKYIILYVLFIAGISIIAEWISCSFYTKKSKRRVHFEDELNDYLDNLKMQMQRQYIQKVDEFIEGRRENFTNDLASYQPVSYAENLDMEQAILAQLDEKIRMSGGLQYSLDNHSAGRKTIGQAYSAIDNDNQVITYRNLSEKYKTTPREVTFENSERTLAIPRRNTYTIDHKYNFEPSTTVEYPSKYDPKFGRAPQNQSTFYDKKYDVENYTVKANDSFSNNYLLF